MNNSHWSPRPEARSSTPYRRRTPSPTKSTGRRHSPSPSAQLQWTKKRERGDWSDSTDSAPESATYQKESAVPDKVESTILSPESPPEYEKGLSSLDYVSESPIYRPVGYSDGESDKDSLIDLAEEENWDGDNSSDGPKNPNPPEEEASQKDTSAEQKERSPTPSPTRKETTLTTSTWTQMKCFSQDSPR